MGPLEGGGDTTHYLLSTYYVLGRVGIHPGDVTGCGPADPQQSLIWAQTYALWTGLTCSWL